MRVNRLFPAVPALCAVLLPFLHGPALSSEQQWVAYSGGDGPGPAARSF